MYLCINLQKLNYDEVFVKEELPHFTAIILFLILPIIYFSPVFREQAVESA